MLPLLYVLLACRPATTEGAGSTDLVADGDDDDDGTSGDDDDTSGDDDDDTAGDDDDTSGDDDDDDDDTSGDDDDDTSGDDDDDTVPTADTDDTGCVDDDGDGVDSCSDCDDDDPLVFPGAPERCNGLDDDCDGTPLDDEVDDDGDGALDCASCDAAGYWLATRELTGSDLGDAVATAVAAQTCKDYGDAREFLFAELDNDAGTIRCRYTGRTRSGVGAGFTDWEDFNTEHTWPQSLGAGSEPARCDLHHLFITDAVTNSQRGSHPFGYVVTTTTSISGGSKLGTDSSGSTVFEPRDDHKGDVARALTYFAYRYGHTLSASELSLYQEWHGLDPVDAAEIARSMAIAEEQVLANPFVTCPSLLPAL